MGDQCQQTHTPTETKGRSTQLLYLHINFTESAVSVFNHMSILCRVKLAAGTATFVTNGRFGRVKGSRDDGAHDVGQENQPRDLWEIGTRYTKY